MENKKKQFKVHAEEIIYHSVVIEADSIEEANKLAEDMDINLFTENRGRDGESLM